MKTGTIKYSAEFRSPDGFSRWAGIELQYDQSSEDPIEVYKSAVDTITSVIQASAGAVQSPISSTELPVINKADEKLEIAIDNCKTKEELLQYRTSLSSLRLADLFIKKMASLK